MRITLFSRLFSALERWRLLRNPEVRYIVEVGVDAIPVFQRPRPPAIGVIGGVAETIDETSGLLLDVGVVGFFERKSAKRLVYDAVLLGRDGLLLILAAAPSRLRGPWLLRLRGDELTATLLVYDEVVTGAAVEDAGETRYGRSAAEALEEATGSFRVEAVALRERIAEWRPREMTIYVRGIDRQHQFLVENLNMLYIHAVAGAAREVLDKVLGNLVDYTRFHFRSEEVLMEKYRYPGLQLHRREHRAFTDRVTRFYAMWKSGETSLTLEVLRFLATWVAGHIAGTDHLFGEWLRREARAPITYDPGAAG